MIIFDDATDVRFLSRLDPRIRLAAVIIFSVTVCLCNRSSVLTTGLAAGVMLLMISGISFRKAVHRLIPVNAFMILLALTMPIFIPGREIFHFGPLQWSSSGFLSAADIAARANAVMLVLTALLGAMEAPDLGFAMNGLGCPSKFTHLMFFMIRYTEIIHHEYHHLRDAMLLRGFRPRSNRHTLNTFGYLIGQLLIRSINRSERILDAMKCRGFNGHFYVLHTSKITHGDIAFSAIALVFMSLLITMELI